MAPWALIRKKLPGPEWKFAQSVQGGARATFSISIRRPISRPLLDRPIPALCKRRRLRWITTTAGAIWPSRIKRRRRTRGAAWPDTICSDSHARPFLEAEGAPSPSIPKTRPNPAALPNASRADVLNSCSTFSDPKCKQVRIADCGSWIAGCQCCRPYFLFCFTSFFLKINEH